MTEFTYDEKILSDLHKDAYGFRPSESFFREWDNSWPRVKQAIWDNLLEALKNSIEEDLKEEEFAARKFEKRIAEIQALMNNSREDAIRVIIQAEDKVQDVEWYGYESLEYELGLKYDYISASLKGD